LNFLYIIVKIFCNRDLVNSWKFSLQVSSLLFPRRAGQRVESVYFAVRKCRVGRWLGQRQCCSAMWCAGKLGGVLRMAEILIAVSDRYITSVAVDTLFYTAEMSASW